MSKPTRPAKDRNTPPASEAAGAEEVLFSAYYPDSVGVDGSHSLRVYAHIQGMLEAITSDAGQILGMVAADYHDTDETDAGLPTGTEIEVIPVADGITFEPASSTLVWSGTWQRADFTMQAGVDTVGQEIEGTISCYVGPVLIADLQLPIRVAKLGEETESPGATHSLQTAAMYEAIFASYSHRDSAIVEAVESTGTALGLTFLSDVMALKSSERWSEELLQMIEQADVFQLFWSEESSRSPFVEQEWRHALHLADLKSPQFIHPIYWQKPRPPVPPPLYHIHFAPVAPPRPIQTADLSSQAAEAPATGGAALSSISNPASPSPADLAEGGLDALTVSTFTAADPSAPEPATLKARTRITLSGDIESFLAESASEEAALAVHEKTVAAALQARLAYLELLAGKKR